MKYRAKVMLLIEVETEVVFECEHEGQEYLEQEARSRIAAQVATAQAREQHALGADARIEAQPMKIEKAEEGAVAVPPPAAPPPAVAPAPLPAPSPVPEPAPAAATSPPVSRKALGQPAPAAGPPPAPSGSLPPGMLAVDGARYALLGELLNQARLFLSAQSTDEDLRVAVVALDDFDAAQEARRAG